MIQSVVQSLDKSYGARNLRENACSAGAKLWDEKMLIFIHMEVLKWRTPISSKIGYCHWEDPWFGEPTFWDPHISMSGSGPPFPLIITIVQVKLYKFGGPGPHLFQKAICINNGNKKHIWNNRRTCTYKQPYSAIYIYIIRKNICIYIYTILGFCSMTAIFRNNMNQIRSWVCFPSHYSRIIDLLWFY